MVTSVCSFKIEFIIYSATTKMHQSEYIIFYNLNNLYHSKKLLSGVFKVSMKFCVLAGATMLDVKNDSFEKCSHQMTHIKFY